MPGVFARAFSCPASDFLAQQRARMLATAHRDWHRACPAGSACSSENRYWALVPSYSAGLGDHRGDNLALVYPVRNSGWARFIINTRHSPSVRRPAPAAPGQIAAGDRPRLLRVSSSSSVSSGQTIGRCRWFGRLESQQPRPAAGTTAPGGQPQVKRGSQPAVLSVQDRE